jgi:hypothetical protein
LLVFSFIWLPDSTKQKKGDLYVGSLQKI